MEPRYCALVKPSNPIEATSPRCRKLSSSSRPHTDLAVVAIDPAVRLTPYILLAALRATELRLGARPLLLTRPQRRFQIEPPLRCSEPIIGLLELTARNDQTVHMLTRLTSTNHSS